MSLYYRNIEGGKQPLLVLHGVFGSSDNWLTMGKKLAEAGYNVYLLDQRNHGRSPHLPEMNYPSMASDLREFIEEKALENPILIGHSMGGKTVMEYVSRYPRDVSQLIVVDIAPKAYKPHHGRLLEGLSAIPLEQLQSRKEADEILSGYEPILSVRQFLLKNLYTKEGGAYAWRLNLPVIKRDMIEISKPVTSATPLDLKTLFIKGEKSNYILEEDKEAIRQMFPNAQIIGIEDAGHWVHAEQPNRFLSAVLNFLGSN